MNEIRIQTLNRETVVEVTTTVTEKERHTESDLLRRKAYFEELIAKGTAGLSKVTELLSHIDNERAKTQG